MVISDQKTDVHSIITNGCMVSIDMSFHKSQSSVESVHTFLNYPYPR